MNRIDSQSAHGPAASAVGPGPAPGPGPGAGAAAAAIPAAISELPPSPAAALASASPAPAVAAAAGAGAAAPVAPELPGLHEGVQLAKLLREGERMLYLGSNGRARCVAYFQGGGPVHTGESTFNEGDSLGIRGVQFELVAAEVLRVRYQPVATAAAAIIAQIDAIPNSELPQRGSELPSERLREGEITLYLFGNERRVAYRENGIVRSAPEEHFKREMAGWRDYNKLVSAEVLRARPHPEAAAAAGAGAGAT